MAALFNYHLIPLAVMSVTKLIKSDFIKESFLSPQSI